MSLAETIQQLLSESGLLLPKDDTSEGSHQPQNADDRPYGWKVMAVAAVLTGRDLGEVAREHRVPPDALALWLRTGLLEAATSIVSKFGDREKLDPVKQRMPLVEADLRSLELSGLQVGSASNLKEGWLNSDLSPISDLYGNTTRVGTLSKVDGKFIYLQHDATTPFPIEGKTLGAIYSEHFIEHVSREQAVAFLAEARRLLRPGGFVRITTPDLDKYMAGWTDPQGTFYKEHVRQFKRLAAADRQSKAWMANQIFRFYGHQWIYDFAELSTAAQKAGFGTKSIRRCAFGEGHDPVVAAFDLAERRDETLYVELFAD